MAYVVSRLCQTSSDHPVLQLLRWGPKIFFKMGKTVLVENIGVLQCQRRHTPSLRIQTLPLGHPSL